MAAVPLDQVNWFLLRKQHLAPQAQGSDVLQVVNDICALHATSALAPYLSLWSRIAEFQPEQLHTELYTTHRLVKQLCMRATLHIVPAARLPVFFQATGQRLEQRFLRQMSQLLVWAGLCAEGEQVQTLQRLQQRIVAALEAHGPATVSELSEWVPELTARVEYAPDKAYGGQFSIGTRLVADLGTTGLLVRARPRGTWRSNLYEYALLRTWLPDVDLEACTPQEAQVQLVRYYLHAFGPATVEDIAWWSGFSKGETRKALSALAPEVLEIEVEGMDGRHVLLATDQTQLGEAQPGPEPSLSLLPSLDPYIMGYRDRRRFLASKHYDQVFDRSGNAFPTVWVNGRVVGIWREAEPGIELLVWEDVDQQALTAEAVLLGHFLRQAESGHPPVDGEIQAVVNPYPADLYVRTPFTLGRR